MGLDYVELVMGIEETFEVRFEDTGFRDIVTVGDLNRLVLTKLDTSPALRRPPVRVCMTSRTFYRFRRAFMQEFGAGRRQITPDTRLDDLIPKHDRRNRWKQLGDAAGYLLPDLRVPDPVFFGLFAASVLVAFFPVALGLGREFPFMGRWWFIAGTGTVVFALGMRLLKADPVLGPQTMSGRNYGGCSSASWAWTSKPLRRTPQSWTISESASPWH